MSQKRRNARPARGEGNLPGQGTGGFIGFGAFAGAATAAGAGAAEEAASLSAGATASPVYGGTDSELSVALKHLGKKAAATKARALEDLISLLGSRDKKAMRSVLPNWSHHYPMLAVHPDRRVRELSHQTMSILAQGTKQRIAKFLPLLLPPWRVGCYDPAREVAAAAEAAWVAVFPKTKKQHEALWTFCESIITHAQENVRQPASFWEDRLVITREEAEEVQTRTGSGALSSVSHVIETLPRWAWPSDDFANAEDGIPAADGDGTPARAAGRWLHDALVEGPLLGAVGRSAPIPVRRASNRLLEVLFEQHAPMTRDLSASLTSATVRSLQESDPNTLVVAWRAWLARLQHPCQPLPTADRDPEGRGPVLPQALVPPLRHALRHGLANQHIRLPFLTVLPAVLAHSPHQWVVQHQPALGEIVLDGVWAILARGAAGGVLHADDANVLLRGFNDTLTVVVTATTRMEAASDATQEEFTQRLSLPRWSHVGRMLLEVAIRPSRPIPRRLPQGTTAGNEEESEHGTHTLPSGTNAASEMTRWLSRLFTLVERRTTASGPQSVGGLVSFLANMLQEPDAQRRPAALVPSEEEPRAWGEWATLVRSVPQGLTMASHEVDDVIRLQAVLRDWYVSGIQRLARVATDPRHSSRQDALVALARSAPQRTDPPSSWRHWSDAIGGETAEGHGDESLLSEATRSRIAQWAEPEQASEGTASAALRLAQSVSLAVGDAALAEKVARPWTTGVVVVRSVMELFLRDFLAPVAADASKFDATSLSWINDAVEAIATNWLCDTTVAPRDGASVAVLLSAPSLSACVPRTVIRSVVERATNVVQEENYSDVHVIEMARSLVSGPRCASALVQGERDGDDTVSLMTALSALAEAVWTCLADANWFQRKDGPVGSIASAAVALWRSWEADPGDALQTWVENVMQRCFDRFTDSLEEARSMCGAIERGESPGTDTVGADCCKAARRCIALRHIPAPAVAGIDRARWYIAGRARLAALPTRTNPWESWVDRRLWLRLLDAWRSDRIGTVLEFLAPSDAATGTASTETSLWVGVAAWCEEAVRAVIVEQGSTENSPKRGLVGHAVRWLLRSAWLDSVGVAEMAGLLQAHMQPGLSPVPPTLLRALLVAGSHVSLQRARSRLDHVLPYFPMPSGDESAGALPAIEWPVAVAPTLAVMIFRGALVSPGATAGIRAWGSGSGAVRGRPSTPATEEADVDVLHRWVSEALDAGKSPSVRLQAGMLALATAHEESLPETPAFHADPNSSSDAASIAASHMARAALLIAGNDAHETLFPACEPAPASGISSSAGTSRSDDVTVPPGWESIRAAPAWRALFRTCDGSARYLPQVRCWLHACSADRSLSETAQLVAVAHAALQRAQHSPDMAPPSRTLRSWFVFGWRCWLRAEQHLLSGAARGAPAASEAALATVATESTGVMVAVLSLAGVLGRREDTASQEIPLADLVGNTMPNEAFSSLFEGDGPADGETAPPAAVAAAGVVSGQRAAPTSSGLSARLSRAWAAALLRGWIQAHKLPACPGPTGRAQLSQLTGIRFHWILAQTRVLGHALSGSHGQLPKEVRQVLSCSWYPSGEGSGGKGESEGVGDGDDAKTDEREEDNDGDDDAEEMDDRGFGPGFGLLEDGADGSCVEESPTPSTPSAGAATVSLADCLEDLPCWARHIALAGVWTAVLATLHDGSLSGEEITHTAQELGALEEPNGLETCFAVAASHALTVQRLVDAGKVQRVAGADPIFSLHGEVVGPSDDEAAQSVWLDTSPSWIAAPAEKESAAWWCALADEAGEPDARHATSSASQFEPVPAPEWLLGAPTGREEVFATALADLVARWSDETHWSDPQANLWHINVHLAGFPFDWSPRVAASSSDVSPAVAAMGLTRAPAAVQDRIASASFRAAKQQQPDQEAAVGRRFAQQHPLAWWSAEILFHAAATLPGRLARWWRRLPRRKALRVEAHMALDVTPRLLRAQWSGLQAAVVEDQWDAHGFRVRLEPEQRQLRARYQQDEVTLGIIVDVPPAYPLRRVRVRCEQRVAVSETQWRRWEVQMVALLSKRDGAFVDALRLWKSNVDREFEGVDPCPICYSVIHMTNESLPDSKCRVCQNTFHGACLYRWFRSSGESKCPMCRSAFYG